MKFERLDTISLVNKIPEIMKTGGAICCEMDFPLVNVGTEPAIDTEYCTSNNIPVFYVERAGGPLVSSYGDYGFVIVLDEPVLERPPEIIYQLYLLCKKRGLNCTFDHNDLLINGYKTASFAGRILPNGLTYFAIHFSMYMNLDLISKICLKPMVKVPKGLTDFGITKEDIENIINDYNKRREV